MTTTNEPRRRLIFFASGDPSAESSPAWRAYHFALVAHRAGLDAEVRLAGEAVRVLREDGIPPTHPRGSQLREMMSEAVRSSLFVSG